MVTWKEEENATISCYRRLVYDIYSNNCKTIKIQQFVNNVWHSSYMFRHTTVIFRELVNKGKSSYAVTTTIFVNQLHADDRCMPKHVGGVLYINKLLYIELHLLK